MCYTPLYGEGNIYLEKEWKKTIPEEVDRHWFLFQNEQMYQINLSPPVKSVHEFRKKRSTNWNGGSWLEWKYIFVKFSTDRNKLVFCVLIWVSCSLSPQAKYHKIMVVSIYYRHLYSWLCEIGRKTCLLQAKFFDTFWWSHGLRLPRPSENGNSCRRARYPGYCEIYMIVECPIGNLKDRNEELERGNDNN